MHQVSSPDKGSTSLKNASARRSASAIVPVIEEVRIAGLYRETAQLFAVLLPVQSVGVMGDARTYENALVIRCVLEVRAHAGI